MATSLGPMFAILASAPADWNMNGVVDRISQRALKLSGSPQSYWVEVSSRALFAKLDSGAEQWVYVAQILREDAETLFAFETPLERALFIELRELDSIGSKFAAAAVMQLGIAGLSQLMAGGTAGKVAGLGPKTLEKIRNGLKERREHFAPLLLRSSAQAKSPMGSAVESATEVWVETPALLMQTLTKLGLSPHEASKLYSELSTSTAGFESFDVGSQIKALLQRWGQAKARGGAQTLTTPKSQQEL